MLRITLAALALTAGLATSASAGPLQRIASIFQRTDHSVELRSANGTALQPNTDGTYTITVPVPTEDMRLAWSIEEARIYAQQQQESLRRIVDWCAAANSFTGACAISDEELAVANGTMIRRTYS